MTTTTPASPADRPPLELLRLFRGRDDEHPRKTLLCPWIEGRYAYATNGHWCVRMPIGALAQDEREAVPQRTADHPDIAALYGAHDDAWAQAEAWSPLPEIEAPTPCASCDGTGQRLLMKCPACDEDGVFFHHGKEYDCQSCDGNIHVPAGKDDAGAALRTCRSCWGSGFINPDSVVGNLRRIDVGDGGYSQGYLYQLAQIPGLRFVSNGPDGTARFVFPLPGGHQAHGLLMPMRK